MQVRGATGQRGVKLWGPEERRGEGGGIFVVGGVETSVLARLLRPHKVKSVGHIFSQF